jgi:hypothetical protein
MAGLQEQDPQILFKFCPSTTNNLQQTKKIKNKKNGK